MTRQYIILGIGSPFLYAQVVSRNVYFHIIQLRVNIRSISWYLYNLHNLVFIQRFHFVYYSQKNQNAFCYVLKIRSLRSSYLHSHLLHNNGAISLIQTVAKWWLLPSVMPSVIKCCCKTCCSVAFECGILIYMRFSNPHHLITVEKTHDIDRHIPILDIKIS